MEVLLRTNRINRPRRSRGPLARRIARGLGRFAHRVAEVRVTLRDDKGPPGGRDKLCLIQARLKGGGQVIVEKRSTRLQRAIRRCLRRSRRAIAARLLQRRLNTRGRPRGSQLSYVV